MMAKKIMDWAITEPIKENRWVINMSGCNVVEEIPKWIFNSFNIENEKTDGGEDALKLTIKTYNYINFVLTPDMVMDEKNIVIEFLDPTGQTMEKYDMSVDFGNFEVFCDYSKDGILTNTLTYWVKSLKTNGTEAMDKKVLENYKKNKEKTKEKVSE